jgi:hypothetical protein
MPQPIAGPAEADAETHTANDRDRPRGGRDELSYPETQQMGRSADSDQDPGPARQCRSPDHGDAEQRVTDHEHDRPQPIDDQHGRVLVNGVQHSRRLLGENRCEETEVPGHCNQIGYSPSAPPGPIGPRSRASRKWGPSNAPSGGCSARVGAMRTLRLSTVAAVSHSARLSALWLAPWRWAPAVWGC